jgi:FtsP/CotA-like multicopper oxidase with cupredoxin domain
MRFDVVEKDTRPDVTINKDTELLQVVTTNKDTGLLQVSNPPDGLDWSTTEGQRLLHELRERRAGLVALRAEEPSVPPEHRHALEFSRSGSGGFTINGRTFDLCRDDLAPRVGETWVITFVNKSGGWFHPVHLHLLHAPHGFLVLERNGVPIRPGDQEWGWKETVNVGRNNDTVKVIMKWPEVPVNPGNGDDAAPARDLGGRLAPEAPSYDFYERRYVFHCHNTDHEDYDMMSQMRVDPAIPNGPVPECREDAGLAS